MSKYLCQTTEVYRVDTSNEAMAAIEEAKQDPRFALSKYTNEHKERKMKGEVVDEYYKLTLVKLFNDIKDPASEATVDYNVSERFDVK